MKAKITKLKELIFKNSQFSPADPNFQYLPLKEEHIIEFEERHEVSLPEDFQDFLTQIGNGGPGPGTGILPLKIHKTYSNLALPWIDPKEFNRMFQYNGQENFDVFSNRMDQVFKDTTSDASKMYQAADNGLLCIADAGGGTYYNLVMNGPYKGQVWINAMVSDGGFVWRANNFRVWYEDWLGKKTEQLTSTNAMLEKKFSPKAISTFTPMDLYDLHAFVERLNEVKDKQPVKDLFLRLATTENPSSDILQGIAEYLLHHQEFENHELALQLIKKAGHHP
ncbi:SMI1/KNR4 family protein [Flagellimonas sp. 2504JD1-5]